MWSTSFGETRLRGVDWRCSWRGSPAAGFDVLRAAGSVVRFIGEFRLDGFPSLRCFEELGQIGTTPATARARAETFAHLAGPAWLLDAKEVQHLSLGDVKAEAEFVVE